MEGTTSNLVMVDLDPGAPAKRKELEAGRAILSELCRSEGGL